MTSSGGSSTRPPRPCGRWTACTLQERLDEARKTSSGAWPSYLTADVAEPADQTLEPKLLLRPLLLHPVLHGVAERLAVLAHPALHQAIAQAAGQGADEGVPRPGERYRPNV